MSYPNSPMFAGQPLGVAPCPETDPQAIPRLLVVERVNQSGYDSLSALLASADPTWAIPDSANGALIRNMGPGVVCWTFDPVSQGGDAPNTGYMVLYPSQSTTSGPGPAPAGTGLPQIQAPLRLDTRAALTGILFAWEASDPGGGPCLISVVWTA